MQVQRWPTAWLMTDERLGERLDEAIARASRVGAGIILRHHATTLDARRKIARQIRSEGSLLGISRDVALAQELEADLVHDPDRDPGGIPFSLPVHDLAEAEAAAARRPALVFVSPVYLTRSHPGQQPLGPANALRLAERSQSLAFALGGMDAERGERMMAEGFAGWAGIDCWLRT